MNVASMLKEIDELPVEEQERVAITVWDHVMHGQHNFDLTEEQKAELDRRLADHEENPDDVCTWEEVEKHLSRIR